MKKMKKIVALVAAMVMVLAMAVSVSAATLSVSDGNGDILKNHTFKAYQVFAGNLQEGILCDITWGNGIDNENFLKDISTIKINEEGDTTYFNTDMTAAQVAAVLSENNTNKSLAEKVAKYADTRKVTANAIGFDSNGNAEINPGYYLIVDETNSVADGSAKNASLLQVVNDKVDVTVKTDVMSVEKKVKENVKYTTNDGYGDGYNDVADYNIGDTIPFAFYSKVPNMSNYDTYYVAFCDTYCNGLTFNNDVKVTIDGGILEANQYKVTSDAANNTFKVEISNLKDIPSAKTGVEIRVDYTAILNENAVIGLDGNENEVYLEYSNNPNGEEIGKTVVDKVIVFTYELDTTKIDGDNKETKLPDAEFVLYKGQKGSESYVKVDSNNKVTGWTANKEDASKLVSGEDGLFEVIGLDDGTYHLRETKAPAGYNLLKDDIELLIKAETVNNQDWSGVPDKAFKSLDVTVDGKKHDDEPNGNIKTGIVNVTVENKKGAVLPSTGGIGTTIFYVFGAGLMVVAGVLLITRKRANK